MLVHAAARLEAGAMQEQDQTQEGTAAALLAQNEALARLIKRNPKALSDLRIAPEEDGNDNNQHMSHARVASSRRCHTPWAQQQHGA